MSFYVSLFSEVLEPNKESKDDFFSMTGDPPMGLSKVRKLLHCNWLRVSLIVNLKAVEIEVHKLI